MLDNVTTGRPTELIELEYQEATNAYFKGVQAGADWSKGILSVQTLMFTAFGVLATWEGGEFFASPISVVICTVGGLICLIYIPLLSYYRELLQVCAQRCIEIEAEFDGRLFSKIQGVFE